MRSRCFAAEDKMGFGSDNGSSLWRGFFNAKDADGEMRGEPDSTEEQDDAKEKLRGHGRGAVQGRFERSHIFRRLNENEHCAKSHRHDEDRG